MSAASPLSVNMAISPDKYTSTKNTNNMTTNKEWLGLNWVFPSCLEQHDQCSWRTKKMKKVHLTRSSKMNVAPVLNILHNSTDHLDLDRIEFHRSKDLDDTSPIPHPFEVTWIYSEFILVYWNFPGSPLRPFFCLSVLVRLQIISVHPNSLEVVLVPHEACLVHSEQKVLQVDRMWRDWSVIIVRAPLVLIRPPKTGNEA